MSTAATGASCTVNGYAGFKECRASLCSFDECRPVEYCGDGDVQADASKVCDTDSVSCFTPDGYQGHKTCMANCSDYGECVTPLFCGDVVCSETAESTMNCFSDCPNVCGDGRLEYGETCDDGNAFDNDGCSSICAIEYCGDGAIHTALGEECDGENVPEADKYTCDADCRLVALAPAGYCPTAIYENACGNPDNITFTVERLTFDWHENQNPNISPNGKFITWTTLNTDDGIIRENVFLHNGTSVSQISNNPKNFLDESPKVNSTGHLAWRTFDRSLGYGHIYFFDGQSTSLLSTGIDSFIPEMNECDDVSWYGRYFNEQQHSNMWEIFLQTGGERRQLTVNSVQDSLTSINNKGHVVWRQFSQNNTKIDIMLYDGLATTKLTNNEDNNDIPEISNAGYVAWIGFNRTTGNQAIYRYDGSSIIAVADNLYNLTRVDTNNSGQIAWQATTESTNVEEKLEIFVYDENQIRQITNNNFIDGHPTIADNGFVT